VVSAILGSVWSAQGLEAYSGCLSETRKLRPCTPRRGGGS
jgi:hypothetical protein